MSTLSVEGLSKLLAELGAGPVPDQYGSLSHITSRPVDIYRAFIADILQSHAKSDPIIAYESCQSSNVLSKGDLAIPVPRLQIKGKKPAELCEEIVASFPPHVLLQKPSAVGIHLPIFFSPQPLGRIVLPFIFQRLDSYGSDLAVGLVNSESTQLSLPSQQQQHVGRRKVIVEFSSPNIAKEFHAGHLRSTIIGAFISNLYAIMGWDVLRVNYLGDWGKQFGLLAVGWSRFGSEEALARDPLKHLLEVYARINAVFRPEEEESKRARDAGLDTAEIESKGIYAERNAFFRRLEDREPDAIALWTRFRDISIERYIATYSRLNIAFDEYSGESQVGAATIDQVEKLLKENGIYEQDNSSWIINFKKHGSPSLGATVVRGRTGTSTYLLRDVAAILEREKKYAFDKMIYVVSAEQDMYFKRVFKTLELIGRGDLAARLQHVSFGKVQGMSSRLGTVTFLGDILDQAKTTMKNVMMSNEAKYAQIPEPERVAELVGITSVMAQDMSGKRVNNYPFDMTRMTSFEGDTGPYLQYCNARLHSILRKVGVSGAEIAKFLLDDPTALDEDIAKHRHCADLVRLMAIYPDVTATTFRNLEPSSILTYLFRLAHQLSSCYDVVQVMGATEGRRTTLARAALYEAARQVLENGMRLLGFTPVDR